MQIGMIGLGRMGANMVRRLLEGSHECVVFDRVATAVEELAREKAVGASSLADLVSKLKTPRAIWMMIPGAFVEQLIADLLPHLEPGDILIDGGNSYYVDDIRLAKELAVRQIHYVDCGTSGGVMGLERGYCLMIGGPTEAVQRLEPVFKTLAPGAGDIPRTPGRDTLGGTAEQGYLHCGPSGAGHFVKMVHNGIEYGLMAAYAEGMNLLAHANVGQQHTVPRRRDDAAAPPGGVSIRSQSARCRGGLAARQRHRLVAAGSDGGRPAQGPDAGEVRRAGIGFRRGTMDDQGGHRCSRAGPGAQHGALLALQFARGGGVWRQAPVRDAV